MDEVWSSAGVAPPRIMVTGAGGFVGRHLVKELAAHLPKGGRVIACSRNGSRDIVPDRAGAAFLDAAVLDLSDAAGIEAVVRRVMPTHIVHLAGISTLAAVAAEPDLAWQVNLFGTLRLAEALSRHCPGGHFVFAGSSEVYGRSFQGGKALDETALLQPANLYACTKAAADQTLGQMASDSLSVMRVRPFNHIGPGQTERFALSAFAAQIARIERGLQPPVIRVGNLESQRDFLDVRDVADAYRRIVERAGSLPNGTVLNIASGFPRRIREALEGLLELADRPIEVAIDERHMRPSDTPLVLGDARRARDLLGWVPTRCWTDTLRDILDHWRQRVSCGDPVSAGSNAPQVIAR